MEKIKKRPHLKKTPSLIETIEKIFLLEVQLPKAILINVANVSHQVNTIIFDVKEIRIVLEKESTEKDSKLTVNLSELPEESLRNFQKTLMELLNPKQRILMIEFLLDKELNNKQKIAFLKGHNLNMPELLEEAEFTAEEIEYLAQKNVLERRKQLHETVDGLTGFRGKPVISSKEGMADINRKIPGEKIFMFLDFNNMGPPNDFELGGEIDKFIKFFADLSRKMFGNIPHEFLRLGGDEFGLFLPDTPEAIAKYEDFFDELEAYRKEIFNAENLGKNYEDTIKNVEIRMGMRKLRKVYEAECKQQDGEFTILNFVNELKGQGGRLPKGTEKFSVERIAGLLQLDLTEHDPDKGNVSILTNAKVAVRVGENPDPRMISTAMQIAEAQIHKYKPLGQPVPENILELPTIDKTTSSKNIEDMSDEEYEIHLQEKQSERFEKLRRDYLENPSKRAFIEKDLYNFKFIDSGLNNVFKLNLAKNESAQKLLGISQSTKFNLITVDIPYFGAINNNEGYTKGDAILRKISEKIEALIGSNDAFRLGGGCLKILTKKNINWNEFKTELNQLWESETFEETTLAEASEKQALEKAKEAMKLGNSTLINYLTPEFKFNKLKISLEDKFLFPRNKMYEIF